MRLERNDATSRALKLPTDKFASYSRLQCERRRSSADRHRKRAARAAAHPALRECRRTQLGHVQMRGAPTAHARLEARRGGAPCGREPPFEHVVRALAEKDLQRKRDFETDAKDA